MSSAIYLSWEKNRTGYEIVEVDHRLVDWTSLWDGRSHRPAADVAPGLSKRAQQCLDRWRMNLAPDKEHDRDEIIQLIEPITRSRQSYLPLETYRDLYMRFADTELTANGVKDFANTFGLLERNRPAVVSHWYGCIQRMREVIDKTRSNPDELQALFNANRPQHEFDQEHFVNLRHKQGDFEVTLEPASLLDALWLQLAFAIAAKAEFLRCGGCGQFIAISPTHGARSDKRYCSDKCRVAAHRMKERKTGQRSTKTKG